VTCWHGSTDFSGRSVWRRRSALTVVGGANTPVVHIYYVLLAVKRIKLYSIYANKKLKDVEVRQIHCDNNKNV